jgi:hypothetical protein
MKQIRIVDNDRKPIRYAYLDHENLKFEFEYYAQDDYEGDYEVLQTVLPADFASIVTMFGFDTQGDILTIIQEISDSGRGENLINALDDQSIKNENVSWRR